MQARMWYQKVGIVKQDMVAIVQFALLSHIWQKVKAGGWTLRSPQPGDKHVIEMANRMLRIWQFLRELRATGDDGGGGGYGDGDDDWGMVRWEIVKVM